MCYRQPQQEIKIWVEGNKNKAVDKNNNNNNNNKGTYKKGKGKAKDSRMLVTLRNNFRKPNRLVLPRLKIYH